MNQPPDAGAEIRTFLIADVRGYTLFTQERGDEAAAKLAAKFATIAREGVEARGGSVIELRGDEALAVFGSPRQALRAAVDLQLRFVDETVADPALPLPVGIGLDAGEAVAVEGGYRGGALNLAARLCGQAGPGEVLASYEVVHLARKVEGLTYIDQGTVHLKGLADPVRVARVLPETADDPARIFTSVLAPARRRAEPARRGRVFPQGLRSRRGLAVGLAVLLVAVGIPLVLTRGGGGLKAIGSNAVGVIDLSSGRISGAVAVGSRPGAVAFGAGAVWVVDEEADSVSKIDPTAKRVVDTIPVGTDPIAIAFGAGALWVVSSGDGKVARINPDAGKVVDTIPTGNGPIGIAVGRGQVWVANTLDGTVSQIDPNKGPIRAIDAGANPNALSVDGAVWVTNSTSGTVSRIDPGSGTLVGSVHVGNGPTAVVASGDDLWVANNLDGTVSRIDTRSSSVTATIRVGQGPTGIALGGGSVWVANEHDGTVSRIDPTTNTVAKSIDVGSAPSGLAVVGGDLWVTVRGAGGVHRGGKVSLGSDILPTPDPAAAYDSLSWAIAISTNDGLVALRKAAGPAGTTLVPDLATSLPEPTDGGTTYTFQLRNGIRYSTGATVTAKDIRYSIERDLHIGDSPAHQYYASIIGAKECTLDPKTCDLSRGIVSDEASRTVIFHLSAPDPAFLYKLALPAGFIVPEGTPFHGSDQKQTVPATGPYMVESITDKVVELARNPRFREWSRAAQPDGFPDRIAIAINPNSEQLIQAVERGKFDAAFGPFAPLAESQRLQTLYASQVHLFPLVAVHFLFMNSRERPFNDVRVRQAVNYAVDRNRVVELFGGPLSARPTCQVLPPNSPGYSPYCPYTVSPTPTGRWTAPDLAKAKQLVQESGTAGSRVTLIFPPYWPKGMGSYLVSVLRDLGYRASLRVPGTLDNPSAFFNAIQNSKYRTQIGFVGWIPDFPAASAFINVLLSCAAFVPNNDLNNNYGQFCDPAIDAQIQQALDVQQHDQSKAGELWAKIDRALVDKAALAPLFNLQGMDFLSKRARNYVHNPEFGMLLDQLWVR